MISLLKNPKTCVLAALVASASLNAQEPPENLPPAVDLGDDVSVVATSEFTSVTLTPLSVDDPDGDNLLITYAWSLPLDSTATFDGTPDTPTITGNFPVGDTLVTLTVTDELGATATDDVLVSVSLPAPPDISCSVDPELMWPPNHKMTEVTVTIQASSEAVMSLTELVATCLVSSDEPDRAVPGDKPGDVHGYDGYTEAVPFDLEYDEQLDAFVGSLRLRSERQGSGSGRTYTIACTVTDPFGQTGEDTCIVFVPHDRSQGLPSLVQQIEEEQQARKLRKKKARKQKQKQKQRRRARNR